MKEKQFTLFVLSMAIGLTVVLGRCSPVPAPSEAMSATPETVVESFYNWYIGYPGNPLVDGAYRSSEHLTTEFVRKVDEIIASFDKGGYDPFLCAQDVPGSFTVDKAVVSGEEARVVVHGIWNPGTQYELNHGVTVILRMVNGQWKIADVICPVPEPVVVPAERCPNATTGTQLLKNERHGYCLLYPTGYSVHHNPSPRAPGQRPCHQPSACKPSVVRALPSTTQPMPGSSFTGIISASLALRLPSARPMRTGGEWGGPMRWTSGSSTTPMA